MNAQESPSNGIDDKDIQSLKQEVLNQIDDRIAGVISTLPPQYFDEMEDDERLEHFKAVVAIKVCDIDHEITLRQKDGRRVSVISCENYPGQLARLIKDLPDDFPLVGAKIFTAAEEELIVDVFEFRTDHDNRINDSESLTPELAALVEQVAELTGDGLPASEAFIKRYHQGHEILESPEEIADQYIALKETEHINDIKVLWKEKPGVDTHTRTAKVTISAASSTTRAILLRASCFFGYCGHDIRRAICENVIVRDVIDVALLTFHIIYPADAESKTDSQRFCHSLETFLRLDQEIVESFIPDQPSLVDTMDNIVSAEILCALGRLTQHTVNFTRRQNVSHERVFRVLLKHRGFTEDVLTRFRSRFESDVVADREAVETSFHTNLESITDATDQLILRTYSNLALSIQRCNLSIGRRRGLAFRLPGHVFENEARGESPFAVFYVFGSGFDGFHVRFRDVARGGMRLIPTRNREHYSFESTRVFEEAWRLATAQQLKNKDIAEGGAKSVVVIKPETDHEKAGRDFVDGLLDLIINPSATSANDVAPLDYEYLYLGPDENVTNNLINWIVERSAERGYEFPSTIMSSKPLSGINHKRYGVTSEGVLIFLRQALLEHGIDPHVDSFSVKLTGGPDGDVGGNAIRILIRDYGDHVNFVGISDGTGSAIDPSGLAPAELLRLVDGELGIVHFSAEELSSNGSVMGLEDERQIARRNQMHNEVKADVFLPAGGRPSTINESNWQDFLDNDGKPSSPMVVEGANLFLTDHARLQLSKAGVTIVKDSSANKCGVICSSLEIIAGMLMSEEEFIAMKPGYVEEVLDLLRELARTEAICLFNEHVRRPDLTLPEISDLISREIIRVADIIHQSLDTWSQVEQEYADRCIEYFLPKILVDRFDEPISSLIPPNYRRHLIGAILSSRIVYREGVQNLSTMSSGGVEDLARSQVLYETRVRAMVAQLESSDLPDRALMMQLLEHSGARVQRELKLPKQG